MPVPEPPNPGLVFETMNAFQRTAALRAAVELDLFSALGEGCSSVADLAGRCQATPRGIRILCDFLTIIRIIEKDGELYRHSPTSAAFLDPKSPACVASTVRFVNDVKLMAPFDHLTEIVRSGLFSSGGRATVEPENPVWVEFARSMAPMMAPLVRPLGTLVLNGDRAAMRVLDVAAGHGLFGIEVARLNPRAEIVALDWPAVLEIARANAQGAGVESRYRLKPGNAFEVEFDGPYEIILLTNFLHHFSRETCIALLRKCGKAMVPGGLVAALEFVPNPDRITPPQAASFAMTMLATTEEGDAHTFPDYQWMFSEAGFKEIELHDVPASPHRIVKARWQD
jgi:2-polyprenyl-3-methyl-5-hydroxy-6-metoxy-1,4-benzoquinol methylase